MIMTPFSTGLVMVVAAMAVESVAQLLLKIGAAGGPGHLLPRFRALAERLPGGGLARTWIALGVTAYVLEIVLYTLALHGLDVSVAFPLGSLCFVGVALLSRVFLGEAVGRVRWLGIACILVGTVVVAL